MQRLGAKNGMVDCMIWWHIKRDIFDMPVLVCMSVSLLLSELSTGQVANICQVMPVLDKGLH